MTLLILILFLLLSRPFVVLVHELGHALTVMALTRRPAAIYLIVQGGGPARHLRLGGLDVYFSPSWRLPWYGGYCHTSESRLTWGQQVLYVLGGPLAPALLATLAFYLGRHYDAPDNVQVLLFYFLAAGVMGLIFNLRPNPERVILPDGSVTYNDGQLLLRLWQHRRGYARYQQAMQHYQQQEYGRAGALFLRCLPQHPDPAEVLRFAMSALALHKDYPSAYDLGRRLREQHPEHATEPALRFTHALMASRLDRHPEALDLYSELLLAHPDYTYAYLNRGFTHYLLGNYPAALADFDEGLQLEPTSAYALANRGLARLKLGEPAAGLADLERARQLDPDNAYVPRSWGIYHLERGEAPQALACFRRAQLLDPETQGIAELLHQAEQLSLAAQRP